MAMINTIFYNFFFVVIVVIRSVAQITAQLDASSRFLRFRLPPPPRISQTL